MHAVETPLHVGVTLCLPYDSANLGVVSEVMAYTLRLLGGEDSVTDDMRQSVADTCAAVLEGAAEGDVHEVEVSIDERSCTVLLHDLGPV